MQYSGPRPACRALDSLMDELGDPVVALIEKSSMPGQEKEAFKAEFENLLIGVFAHQENTAMKLRTYIYELNRELAK